MAKYLNITSSSELLLTEDKEQGHILSSMSICNTSSNVAVVDLYYKKTSDNTKYYLLENINIPAGVTLYLTNADFPGIFNFSTSVHRLAIHNTGGSPSLTVIIK